MAPLDLDALAGNNGRGPSAGRHLSGVAPPPPWKYTSTSEATRWRIMWVQVMTALKSYLVRRERGMIEEQTMLLKVLRNHGDVAFRCIYQKQERQDGELWFKQVLATGKG